VALAGVDLTAEKGRRRRSLRAAMLQVLASSLGSRSAANGPGSPMSVLPGGLTVNSAARLTKASRDARRLHAVCRDKD